MPPSDRIFPVDPAIEHPTKNMRCTCVEVAFLGLQRLSGRFVQVVD
jgi:hypothetical protein